VNKIET